MEATLIIKLPDGSTRTVELTNATINTVWNNISFGGTYDGASTNMNNIGHITLQANIKDISLVGSI
jgi:hypothetical protein